MDNYCFGKFKKAKYELTRNGVVIYFFVTTIHDEKESVEFLKDMIRQKMEVEVYPITYAINKIQEGIKKELFRVRINCIAA